MEKKMKELMKQFEWLEIEEKKANEEVTNQSLTKWKDWKVTKKL